MHGLILGRDFRFHEFSDVAMTVAAFGATLILATLSWHFLEKPIVRWGHSWSYEDKPGAAL
jgi:peptidoglycan/LPS O-acetylase OafA/YrhL